MTPRPRLLRSSLPVATLLALALAATPAAAVPATIIDSFTDPLPANPFLPASGKTVLFLGSLCDGAECPPATVVANPQESFDRSDQLGLPGVVGSFRQTVFGTYFEPNPGANGVLTIDGGRLSAISPDGPLLQVQLKYGSDDVHLNLDLEADDSDRLEIEILSAYTTPFDLLQVGIVMGQGRRGTLGAPWANYGGEMAGPGVLLVPYKDMGGRFEDLAHDVDWIDVYLTVRPHAGSELAVGEIRTASTPTPTRPDSWGRLKDAYRR